MVPPAFPDAARLHTAARGLAAPGWNRRLTVRGSGQSLREGEAARGLRAPRQAERLPRRSLLSCLPHSPAAASRRHPTRPQRAGGSAETGKKAAAPRGAQTPRRTQPESFCERTLRSCYFLGLGRHRLRLISPLCHQS